MHLPDQLHPVLLLQNFRLRGRRQSGGFSQFLLRRMFSAPSEKYAFGNCTQPGRQLAAFIKTVNRADGLLKCLLRQLFRQVRIPRKREQIAVHCLRILLIYLLHRLQALTFFLCASHLFGCFCMLMLKTCDSLQVFLKSEKNLYPSYHLPHVFSLFSCFLTFKNVFVLMNCYLKCYNQTDVMIVSKGE